MSSKKRYRANVAVEWQDRELTEKNGTMTSRKYLPGAEFEDPPEHANIAELVKHKAVEVIK